jgi:hypothetical protein
MSSRMASSSTARLSMSASVKGEGRNISPLVCQIPAVIFCGHFPDGAEKFTKTDIVGETTGEWYLRQMLGSAKLRGYRGNTASIAPTTSCASGSVRGRNRLTTAPLGATRNFSKFH